MFINQLLITLYQEELQHVVSRLEFERVWNPCYNTSVCFPRDARTYACTSDLYMHSEAHAQRVDAHNRSLSWGHGRLTAAKLYLCEHRNCNPPFTLSLLVPIYKVGQHYVQQRRTLQMGNDNIVTIYRLPNTNSLKKQYIFNTQNDPYMSSQIKETCQLKYWLIRQCYRL